MKAIRRILLLIPFVVAVTQVASAGRSDDIVKAMAGCGQQVTKKEAVKYIKKLFLCSPGAKVQVGSCTLECLKKNAGNVTGN